MIEAKTLGPVVEIKVEGPEDKIVQEYIGTMTALLSSYKEIAEKHYETKEEIDMLIANTLSLIANSVNNSCMVKEKRS